MNVNILKKIAVPTLILSTIMALNYIGYRSEDSFRNEMLERVQYLDGVKGHSKEDAKVLTEIVREIYDFDSSFVFYEISSTKRFCKYGDICKLSSVKTYLDSTLVANP